MGENEDKDKEKQEEQDQEPSVTVDIKPGAKIKSTINWKSLTPDGGWNPLIHQKDKKPIGKSKY